MKNRLLKMIQAKEGLKTQRKAEYKKDMENAKDSKELRSLYTQYNKDIDTLDGEIQEYRGMVAEIEEAEKRAKEPDTNNSGAAGILPEGAKPQKRDSVPEGGDGSSKQEPQQRSFNILNTYSMGENINPKGVQQRSFESLDLNGMDPVDARNEILKTYEYRSAYFKNLMKRKLTDVEQRALTTAANSGGAAVPTTTFNMIIEKLRQTSVLFPLIQVTYIPGNVDLPVANVITAGEWSAEAVVGNITDDTVQSVNLTGYTLAKYAQISIAAQTMTIDAFEQYIVTQISNQLAIAIENAILTGKGGSPVAPDKPQPTGILTGVTFDTTNSKEFSTSVGYDDLVDARALLNSAYRTNARWIMNGKMEAEIFKIKTTTNKPIFSQTPQNGFEPRILNIPYLVDDYMPDDTILLANLAYYYMNFSQQPIIENSRDAGFTSASTIYRGVLVADGKPALSEAYVKISKDETP